MKQTEEPESIASELIFSINQMDYSRAFNLISSVFKEKINCSENICFKKYIESKNLDKVIPEKSNLIFIQILPWFNRVKKGNDAYFDGNLKYLSKNERIELRVILHKYNDKWLIDDYFFR